jgi:hypothetical protein
MQRKQHTPENDYAHESVNQLLTSTMQNPTDSKDSIALYSTIIIAKICIAGILKKSNKLQQIKTVNIKIVDSVLGLVTVPCHTNMYSVSAR